jgi:FlaA1/EpsC-like NDP-sugar epimerase
LSLLVDTALVYLAWWLAFWFRFNLDIPGEFESLAALTGLWSVVVMALVLWSMKVYRQVWRFTSLPELQRLVFAVVLGAAAVAAVVLIQRYPNFPRSVLLLHPLFTILLLSAVRASWRSVMEGRAQLLPQAKPLLVAGTLEQAAEALRSLKGARQWHPIGIITPDRQEVGRSIQNVPVLGTTNSIGQHAESTGAHTVLVASAAGSEHRRSVLLSAGDSGLSLLTLPRADEWMDGVTLAPRNFEIEDLLGRGAVELDLRGLSELFAGKTVLVSGAGGSIGSELCRQTARFGAARLVCIDVSEIAVYRLEQELRGLYPLMAANFYTANVREPERLHAVATSAQPSIVFHAAAYKHVPLMEDLNEIEAIRTNVLGTLHAARAAGAAGAARFVLISTDKAVNPTNVMGATKRLAERVVQAVAKEYPQTQFVSVRFGNVLGSSGSVVPLFEQQIAKGGPVTVTHPDIVRYFMTIPEAARLVLQAGLMGKSGQIFVLDMGEPVKIVDLARMMIRLSGKTEQEIPIAFSGLRPGEKLFEELLANDETTEPTPHPKLRVAKVNGSGGAAAVLSIDEVLAWVQSAGPVPDSAVLRQWLRQHVPEYQPQGL